MHCVDLEFVEQTTRESVFNLISGPGENPSRILEIEFGIENPSVVLFLLCDPYSCMYIILKLLD